jgi:hypothetical protein
MLVGYDNKKRLDWSLELVVALFCRSDGCVRVVRMKTALRELTSIVQHIYPLEISLINCLLCSNEEENPLLTSDVELKPAGAEKDIPTKVKKTVKNEVGGK